MTRIDMATLVALALVPAARGQAPFTEEAVARGLVYPIQQQRTFGSGVAFADLDGDGDPDVLAVGKTDLFTTATIGVFENDGTGVFTDRSVASGIPPEPGASGLSAGDFDGDGDLDVYVTVWTRPNMLLRNDGGFQFTDVAGQPGMGGIDDPGAGSSSAWADFDGDGWLDLYVTNRTGSATLDAPYAPSPERNRMFRNLGGAGFVEVAAALGVEADTDPSFQASLFDYDRDGDADLYLANDKGHSSSCDFYNHLWRNDGGTFTDVSVEAECDGCVDGMCVAIGDMDANRWLDVYVTNIQPGNPLYLNQGDGRFKDESETWGVAVFEVGWGSVFLDYDNDADEDLYVCQHLPAYPNRFYENVGAPPTVERGALLGLDDADATFTCAQADVDMDGDLDLLLAGTATRLKLYLNHEGEQRSWAKLRVVGEGPNLHAVGARVEVRVGSAWQVREVIAGSAYKSQDELVKHVGLGAATAMDEIVVTWPGGATSRTLTGYGANRTWTLLPPSRLGDADGDGQVALADYAVLAGCLGSAVEPGCEALDLDGDGAIDAADASLFLAAWDGTQEDCDGSGTWDLEEILLGGAEDLDADGVLDSCECHVATYCVAKTSSQGCVPSTSALGTASASGGAFDVLCEDVLNQKSGMFFYGTDGPLSSPFQGGTLCVAAPRRRTPVTGSGGNPPPDDCSGVLQIDFAARIASGVDPNLAAGAQVHGQWWYRDPAAPSTTGLSDALSFWICP